MRPPVVSNVSVPAHRPGVEDQGLPPCLLDLAQSVHRHPVPHRVRVPLRGQTDGAGGLLVPHRPGPAQAPLHGTLDQLDQVALQEGQDRLRLGVAEAGVELDHLRPFGGEHEPGVEEAAKGAPLGGQAGHRRADDAGHDLVQQRRGDEAGGCVGAHAPGVGAAVAVEDALVVARDAEGDGRLAVAEGEDGGLRALQAALDHHPAAAGAVGPLLHDGGEGGVGLGERVGDDAPPCPGSGRPP